MQPLFFVFGRLKGPAPAKRNQEPIKTISFLPPRHSCPAAANTALGWGRCPGTTYVVQVGEFDFQRGEERPREWLHSHGDDFGVQDGAVPVGERGKRGSRGVFVQQGVPLQPSLVVQGLVFYLKTPQRYLLMLDPILCPLSSPHSQSTSVLPKSNHFMNFVNP